MVSGFEVAGHGALRAFGIVAFDVAANVEIGDGYQKMRAGMVLAGHGASGLEFEFGDADAVLDEEDLFGAVGENFEAAIFVPMSVGVGLQEFDGDVAEGFGADVFHEMDEIGWGEAHVAVGKFHGGRRLVFYGVGNLSVTEGDGDVVVTVNMHLGLNVGVDLDIEDAKILVFEGEMVMGFVGDLNFVVVVVWGWGGLCGEICCADAAQA